MNTLERFIAYAAAFEEAYRDDQWSRIKTHFTEDAVYQVQSKAFGAVLTGPDAIATGLQKSVNGFDRRFDERRIELVGDLQVDGDEVRATWLAHYAKEGVEPYTLRGASLLRLRDGLIAYMADSYDAAVEAELAAWQVRNGLAIDPSYD